MGQEEHQTDIDPLFLALTRPPMVMGVTYSFMVLNLMGTTIFFLAVNSPIAFFIGIPLHVVGYLACLKDPRIFELWRVKLMKTPPSRNRKYWGANTCRP